MALQALRSARSHYRLSSLIARRGAREARRAAPRGLTAVAGVVASHQIAQAVTSERAVAEMLAEQSIDEAAESLLNSTAFTTSVDNFLAMAEAAADANLERLVESLIQDAGRSAESVATAVRPNIYHARFLSPPSCGRCAVLAGRRYRYSEGFQRHPNCFPAGTVVSGPAARGASRRWYEGELVTVRTAGGKEFSVTGNHPVLTSQGWVPANLLREGGDVVSRASGDRSGSLLVPDHDQVPARIEDVWRSEAMRPLGRVPVAAEDFHGDGVGSSEVDVVLADRLLRNRVETAFLQQAREQMLAFRPETPIAFDIARARLELGLSGSLAPAGALGGLSLLPSVVRVGARGAQQPGFAGMAHRDFGLNQAPADDHSRHSSSLRDGELGFAGNVGSDQAGGVDRSTPTPRWDAPAVPFSLENRGAYASRGLDLRDRLASDVHADRIVKTERIGWSGHVYNLTSSEGWYDANGIIVSNCDCTMIPTTVAGEPQDPTELFEQGLIRGLSKADAQAIRDGADMNRVVNVRLARAGLQESGRVLIRRGRLTPEGIYQQSGDNREMALELLTANGYLRP